MLVRPLNLIPEIDILFAAVLWLLAIAPGGVVFAAGRPGRWLPALMIPAGLAISTLVCYLATLISLRIAVFVLPAAVAVGLFFLRGTMHPKVLLARHRYLISAAFLVLVVRLFPLAQHADPRGFDPYFHLLLAQKILDTGAMVRDWLPFADIMTVNYPTGPHALMAVFAKLSGLPLPLIFSTGLVLLVMLVGCQLYITLSSVMPEDSPYRLLPLFAAVSYIAAFEIGAFDYVFWGGLPNVMGLCVLLGLLALICDESCPDRMLLWSVPLLLTGIAVIHHHVMLVSVLLLAAELGRRLLRQGPLRPLLLATVAAVLAGSWYYLPYVMKAAQVTESTVLTFKEPMLTPLKILADGRPLFNVLVFAGAVSFWRRRSDIGKVLPPGTMRVLSQLLLLFVVTEYVVRIASPYLVGREIALFTPSRFFTDAVPFLAVFAGLVLCGAAARIRPFVLVLLVVLAGMVMQIPKYAVLLTPEVSPAKKAAFAWIRANTSPDTLVIDSAWSASYFTGRAASHTPIPSSEFAAPAFARYHQVREFLASGVLSAELQSKPIVCIAGDEEISRLPVRAARLWMGELGLGVFRLN
jgi:hypothetical protein